jgi:hypothetical protein
MLVERGARARGHIFMLRTNAFDDTMTCITKHHARTCAMIAVMSERDSGRATADDVAS